MWKIYSQYRKLIFYQENCDSENTKKNEYTDNNGGKDKTLYRTKI